MRRIVAVLVLALLAAACAEDPERHQAPSATRSGSRTPSQAASSAATETAFGPVDPCLLSVAQLNTALGSAWKITRRTAILCDYRSELGAGFGIVYVNDPHPRAGLAEARSSCASKPRDVEKSSFACVEHAPGGDLVVGNVIANGVLWAVGIGAKDHAGRAMKLRIMTLLLSMIDTG